MFKNEYTMNRKLIVEYVFKIFGTKTIIRGIFIFILGLLMYLKVHLEFEYSQVSKIVQTQNFIVLKLGKQSAILVYKNGFTEGSENEFIKFIEEKIKK